MRVVWVHRGPVRRTKNCAVRLRLRATALSRSLRQWRFVAHDQRVLIAQRRHLRPVVRLLCCRASSLGRGDSSDARSRTHRCSFLSALPCLSAKLARKPERTDEDKKSHFFHLLCCCCTVQGRACCCSSHVMHLFVAPALRHRLHLFARSLSPQKILIKKAESAKKCKIFTLFFKKLIQKYLDGALLDTCGVNQFESAEAGNQREPASGKESRSRSVIETREKKNRDQEIEIKKENVFLSKWKNWAGRRRVFRGGVLKHAKLKTQVGLQCHL
jgi:hypothetical protein